MAATVFGSIAPGCGTDATSADLASEYDDTTPSLDVQEKLGAMATHPVEMLRQVFPDHASEVLEQDAQFEKHPMGFWHRWGAPKDTRDAIVPEADVGPER